MRCLRVIVHTNVTLVQTEYNEVDAKHMECLEQLLTIVDFNIMPRSDVLHPHLAQLNLHGFDMCTLLMFFCLYP